MSKAEDYLKTKVRPILQELVSAAIEKCPKDIISFMINWLQDYSGIKNNNSALEELEKLREEVKKYRKKYNKKDKEMEVSSESEEYISPEEQKKIEEEMMKKKQKKRNFRLSVSAEVYGMHNKLKKYVPRVIKKTNEQMERIKAKCLQSFLFNSLEDKELKTVLDSFEEKKFNKGENVITQGEQGDVLYLVDTGELTCEKVFKKGDPPTYLKTYYPGESFGELALLYNAPRAATIRANTPCILWALDRECFNNIVKGASIKKREKYENTLKKVEILKSIDPYELGQICDAIKNKFVKKGDMIIKENDLGDEFYILDEGKAHAEKTFDVNKGPENVKNYGPTDYFGELALLKNAPRAASIIADTDCKLFCLDRLAFKRLLGPLENILQRNSQTYKKYVNN